MAIYKKYNIIYKGPKYKIFDRNGDAVYLDVLTIKDKYMSSFVVDLYQNKYIKNRFYSLAKKVVNSDKFKDHC